MQTVRLFVLAAHEVLLRGFDRQCDAGGMAIRKQKMDERWDGHSAVKRGAIKHLRVGEAVRRVLFPLVPPCFELLLVFLRFSRPCPGRSLVGHEHEVRCS